MTYFPFPDIGGRHKGAGEVGRDRLRGAAGLARLLARAAGGARGRGPRRGRELRREAAELHRPGRRRARAGRGRRRARALDRRRRGGGGGDPRLPRRRRCACATPARRRSSCASWATQEAEKAGEVTRYLREGGNGADVVDLETLPGAPRAGLGAGSVHHIAFAVPDRAAQLEVRKGLVDTGYQVTPVIDRDYFWSIYFRTPGRRAVRGGDERAGLRPRRGQRRISARR